MYNLQAQFFFFEGQICKLQGQWLDKLFFNEVFYT